MIIITIHNLYYPSIGEKIALSFNCNNDYLMFLDLEEKMLMGKNAKVSS